MQKIIVTYTHPPIAVRKFDYCAYRDGSEESGPYGWGRTRIEALDNLRNQLTVQGDI